MKNRTVRAGEDSPGVDRQNKQLARCPSPHLTLLPGSSGLIWVTENPKGTSGPIGSPIGYDKNHLGLSGHIRDAIATW